MSETALFVRVAEQPKQVTRGVRVLQVIECKTYIGKGTIESPGRILTEYFTLEGEKLAEQDEIAGLGQQTTGKPQ